MKQKTKWLCLLLTFGLLAALTGCGGVNAPQIDTGGEAASVLNAVSYTHLDVYKRQPIA